MTTPDQKLFMVGQDAARLRVDVETVHRWPRTVQLHIERLRIGQLHGLTYKRTGHTPANSLPVLAHLPAPTSTPRSEAERSA